MPQTSTVFMTGLTGYLGCHLAYDLLDHGYHVIALVREGKNGSAQERAENAIKLVDPDVVPSLENLTAVAGTVQGIDDALIAEINGASATGRIDQVWHCAATFKFHEDERPEIRAINIDGVRNVLNLVEKVNGDNPAPRYFHVSTAYSCGREYGNVPEAFTPDSATFRTLYEWSKHEGEAQVVAAQEASNLDATIFRPAIIVGSPNTRVFNDSAYYQVCSAFYRVRKHYADKQGADFDGHIAVRMMADPDTRLNFVPVDYVVDAMRRLSLVTHNETEDLKVFNIVNEEAPTLGFVHKHLCASLGVTGFEVTRETEFGDQPLTRFERALARNIAFQTPYMSDDMGFDTTRYRTHVSEETLPNPVIDGPFLAAINKRFFEALEARQGTKKAASRG